MTKAHHKAKKAATAPKKRKQEDVQPVADATEAIAASETVAEVEQRVKDVAGQVSETVNDRHDRISAAARESFARGRETAARWEQDAARTVLQRPIIAILIAAFIGILVGMLLRKPKRD